jgi:hypothetical protein
MEEVSRQQREMWSEKKTRVDQRIVSLSQPHIRPIVRGKAETDGIWGKALGVLCR